MMELEPALYLVPTPIGNLGDITLRALDVLKNADIIACEDTRHSGTMLKHFDIKPKSLVSYFDHNEAEKSVYLISQILSGKSVALISDAGSPGISDPGYRLIQNAIAEDIKVVSLPGATAFVPALTASGMAVNRFKFFGFPPQKKGRKTFLENAVAEESTIIFYESSHRIEKLIDELGLLCNPERKICISREISKVYEEHIRGTIGELSGKTAKKKNLKGEFVVILEGRKQP
jgi:16S rRNA (cytidine1402-2'-O)-methyltransferase